MSTTNQSTPVQTPELKQSLLKLIEGIRNDPKQADATFKAQSQLTEGFLADINIRDFTFHSDEPKDLGGSDKGPNPVEYVLGAFAACQEIVIKAYATVLGIEVKSVSVDVQGKLDLHGFLNLSDERPGFTGVTYQTLIETDETDEKKLKQLEEFSVNRCPVLDIIRDPVPIEGTLQIQQP
jgi:uncharacterized OsmC-like protein